MDMALTIDVSRLQHVHVDAPAMTASFGAGVDMETTVRALEAQGLVTSTGIGPTVRCVPRCPSSMVRRGAVAVKGLVIGATSDQVRTRAGAGVRQYGQRRRETLH